MVDRQNGDSRYEGANHNVSTLTYSCASTFVLCVCIVATFESVPADLYLCEKQWLLEVRFSSKSDFQSPFNSDSMRQKTNTEIQGPLVQNQPLSYENNTDSSVRSIQIFGSGRFIRTGKFRETGLKAMDARVPSLNRKMLTYIFLKLRADFPISNSFVNVSHAIAIRRYKRNLS